MTDGTADISPREYAIVADAYTRISEARAGAREALCAEFRSQHPSLWEDLRRMLESDPLIAIAAVRVNHTEDDAALVGTQLREWHLIGLIGKGGFGTVYLARKSGDTTQAYALKLLNRAMQTAEGRSRFRHELEAQRVMDHPYIPRVVDRGESETGRPYVVMPFYAGLPVVAYARKLRISVRLKVELFMKICDAVAHAHVKGVMHRDLKPDNVLVVEGPEGPSPAVIDFGLAKAFDADDSVRSNITLEGQMIGTPEYMSPEQALDSRNVDARSDQYSLGCILYEMLTGRPPLTTEEIRSDGRAAMHRVIAEREPVPAHVVSSEVPREVSWICMRCLEKDPSRRYATMDSLIRDLRAFLSGEAIEAAPPTRMYRMRKLVRRHRVAFVGVVATGLALTAGGMASFVFAVQATLQSERSEQISTFVRGIFTQVDPTMVRGRDPEQLLLMLDGAAAQWGVISDPKVDLELCEVFAQAYHTVGKIDKAGYYADRALELIERFEGLDSKRKIEMIPIKVEILRSHGHSKVAWCEEWRRLIDIHLQGDSAERLNQEYLWGTEYYMSAWSGSPSAIFDLYERSSRVLAPEDPLLIKLRFELALHDANGFNPACHRQIQEVRAYAKRVLGEDHPLVHLKLNSEIWALSNSPLSDRERLQFCRTRIRESETQLGPLNSVMLYAYYNLAFLEWEAAEYKAGVISATTARARTLLALGAESTLANWIDSVLALLAVEADDLQALALAEVRILDGSNNGRLSYDTLCDLIAALIKRGMNDHVELWLMAAGRCDNGYEHAIREKFNIPRGAQDIQPSN